MHYERIVAEAVATPWAILPEKLAVIESFLAHKAAGREVPEAEIEAAVQSAQRPGRTAPKGVGVVPIIGTITQRATFFSRWSGGASTEAVGAQVDAFAADPQMGTIVLEIDSPGGGVYGVGQLADKIAAAGKVKPVIAVVNSLAASAAYWIASAATEIVMAPDGEVGSIGVYLMHVDQSAANEREGVKVSFVKAGRLKAAGNSYEPLGDDARGSLQKAVDDFYAMFVSAVARGRKVDEAKVLSHFGEGATVRSAEALKVGMVDKIGTLDSVLGRYGFSSAELRAEDSARPAANLRRRRLEI